MNRETSKKMTSGTQADITSGNACWQTPPEVYKKLNADFGPFDVDLTADASNHLCPLWFGPGSSLSNGHDALTAAWTHERQHKRGYSNPPYGPFVQKLLYRALYWTGENFDSTFLLPMRVTAAFKKVILQHASDLLFCDSRITFFEDGVPRLNEKNYHKGIATGDPAMFDSIIVRFLCAHSGPPRLGIWNVPKHVSANDLERAYVQRQLTDLAVDAAVEEGAAHPEREVDGL